MTSSALFSLLPILLFALVDALSSNIRWAVLAALCCAALELFFIYYSSGTVDPIALIAVALFIVMGYYSMRTENRAYFKLQPAVIAFISAALLVYMQFFGTPIVERYLPLIEAIAPPSIKETLKDKIFLEILDNIFSWLIVLIALDGLWITYAALKCRQWVWVLVNAFGVWILAALLLAGQLAWIYFRQ